jgi:predicted lipid carrier protein YhbT
MRVRRAWPSGRSPGPSPEPRRLAEVMIALRGPVETMLTLALRRLARRRPALFERLGAHQASTFRIAPTDLPVAFDLTPSLSGGTVRVVRRTAAGSPVARMAAPLADLLALFDGSLDADAAFFHRTLQVEGDIAAVMALHNALEAADLRLSDLAPLPVGGGVLSRVLGSLLNLARRPRVPAGA